MLPGDATEHTALVPRRVTTPRAQPMLPGDATEHTALVPRGVTEYIVGNGPVCIQVEFNNGNWWEMPPELGRGLLSLYHQGHSVVAFVWDWHGTRTGSFINAGQSTTINRYRIDFGTMIQTNIDNNRARRVRIMQTIRS